MIWWNTLGSNPLQTILKQGELTTKYFGQFRKISSLKKREILYIYECEDFLTFLMVCNSK